MNLSFNEMNFKDYIKIQDEDLSKNESLISCRICRKDDYINFHLRNFLSLTGIGQPFL